MDPRTGFPLNCRMPSLLGASGHDTVHHAHTHNTGTVWGKINQQNRQHARAFCGYRTCENPRIYPQTPPGMLPVSSILPLILPQTSSHQTWGNSRVARMEHQTLLVSLEFRKRKALEPSGFPLGWRLPETCVQAGIITTTEPETLICIDRMPV